MKKIIFITTLIFLYSKITSQTTKDTVDYSTITFDKKSRTLYVINKVTSGPKSEILKADYGGGIGGLQIKLYSDNKEDWTKTFSCFKNNANYKTSDTIVYLEFDMEKYDKPFNTHQWGIIYFYRNNIITIDKVRAGAYMRREFKVIKWTQTEIILKDNSLKNLNRTYYLKKFYK
jgi:hypothetical protein